MSEGYTIDGLGGEAAGIVVRYDGERGYRFHPASNIYHVLDGQVFATPAAAQRAARLVGQSRAQRLERLEQLEKQLDAQASHRRGRTARRGVLS